MTTHVLALLMSALLAPPHVEIVPLQGDSKTGEWRGLKDGAVTVSQAGSESVTPLNEVLEIRFRAEGSTKTEKPAALLSLGDGSSISCSKLTVADKRAVLTSPVLGDVSLAQAEIQAIRFADRFSSVDDQWTKLIERERKSDWLVIRKEDTLDYLDGVFAGLDEKSVKFLLDGEQESVRRDKVFGLLFASHPVGSSKTSVRVELSNGDVLMAASVSGSDDRLQARLASKQEITLPLQQLRAIDFSEGKLRYLSQMEPRDVKYTPYFDTVWEFRRNTNMDGGPLRLGNKVYTRGLCIHSKTLLKYRLGGDYRRFQALTGIDHLVAANGLGDCRLVISGDGKTLLEADVKAKDSPRSLDLDVTDVVTLEILVDFGGNLDISDHLDLADAKLVK